jgi:hypothetical protein
MAFKWCINCHASTKNDFFGNGLLQTWVKLFFHPNIIIYKPFESPCLVDTIFVGFKKVKECFLSKINRESNVENSEKI